MDFRVGDDIVTVGLRQKGSTSTPPIKRDGLNGITFINLPQLRAQQSLGECASQFALAHVIDSLLANYHKVEVDCGRETTRLFHYTKEARQTRQDANDLTSDLSQQTVFNRTGKNVKATKYYDDKTDGKHTVVVFELINGSNH